MSNMNVVAKDDNNTNPAAEAWNDPEVVKGDQEVMREQIQSGMAEEAIKSANKRSPIDGPTDKPHSVVKEMPKRLYYSPASGNMVPHEQLIEEMNNDWE